jgi:hypothetical protein
MTRTRSAVLVAVGALVVSLVVAVSGSSSASATAPKQVDPSANIALPSGNPCTSVAAAHTFTCSTYLLKALNNARKVLTKTTYSLPTGFLSLTSAEQLLVLTNADRSYYGLTKVYALNSTLNTSARGGIAKNADPVLVPKISSSPFHNYAANWAAGTNYSANALGAYYTWMYADGPGGANGACKSKGQPRCWDHRNGTLAPTTAGTNLYMGVAGGTAAKPYSALYAWSDIYETFTTSNTTIPTIPTITHITPASGTHNGGTKITVTGYGMRHVSSVKVAGTAAKFTQTTSAGMIVTTPKVAKPESGGHVVITTTGGGSSITTVAAYTLT